jgi:hypothetical protein
VRPVLPLKGRQVLGDDIMVRIPPRYHDVRHGSRLHSLSADVIRHGVDHTYRKTWSYCDNISTYCDSPWIRMIPTIDRSLLRSFQSRQRHPFSKIRLGGSTYMPETCPSVKAGIAMLELDQYVRSRSKCSSSHKKI